MKKYANCFSKISEYLLSFANSICKIPIDEEDEPFITYNLTLIYLLSQNTGSLSTLIKKKYYASVASLLRVIIESFFSLNWVTEAKSKKDINERIFKLEAYPLNLYELELEEMEKNLSSDNPVWPPESIKKIRDAIEKEKKDNPTLTEKKGSKIFFKSAPSMVKRMTGNRIKYYHLYSFTSFFSHPTPKLKILFDNKGDSSYLAESIEKPLTETILQCLQFIIGLIGNLTNMYEDLYGNSKRQKLLNKIKMLTVSAINEYNN